MTDLAASVNAPAPLSYSHGPRDAVTIHDMADRPNQTAEALAVGAVLFRAHEAARHLENLLELEAADPRIAEFMRDAKSLRKSIAVRLVDVAIEAVAIEVPDR